MMLLHGLRSGLVVAYLASGVFAGAQLRVGEQAAGSQGGVTARSARLMLLSNGIVQVGQVSGGEAVAAQQNMALAQGSVVSALDKGQAEIEFEDGSVARLTPHTSVTLDYLAENQDGKGYVTILRVIRGLAYLELRASGVARYRVMAGGDTFWPVDNSTVRVNLEDPPAVISVLDGRVLVEHVAAPAAQTADGPQAIEGYRTTVRAGESVRSDAGDASRYFLTESVPPGTWDQWNEERDQAASNEVASATQVREGFAGQQGYGWSDLDASGTWYGAAGQTPVWQPDEALEPGFDPYGYGSWTGFANAGYVWASGYSWGWIPYRCGSWQFWDSFGWGWQPNAFCGSGFQYGGYGLNIGRAPRGYSPVQVPIKRPSGVHPIVSGPHPGERLPLTRGPRQTTEVGGKVIAGLLRQPVHPVGLGYTARGGSAVGSSLRRDFPVDGRTHQALLGTVAAPGVVAIAPVSAGTSWRAVGTRPEAPAHEAGGFHLFGHGARPEGIPVRVDAHGNPFSEPARGREGIGVLPGRSMPQGTSMPRVERSQPVGANPASRGGGAPRVGAPSPTVMHMAPPTGQVVRSAPAASPSPGGSGRK